MGVAGFKSSLGVILKLEVSVPISTCQSVGVGPGSSVGVILDS